MIIEDYVSFETAKLLKEKGFNENTDKQFDSDKIIGDYNITDRSRNPENYIPAPTLQMTMKWLREVHKIAINIGWVDLDFEFPWYCIIMNISKGEILRDSKYYSSYEEACESAIKYCLEHLI